MRPVERILERILEKAENARPTSEGWLASCPVPTHGKGNGDADPSVRISEGSDGRALLKCMAGCPTEDVIAGWGLYMSDLFESHDGRRVSLSQTYEQRGEGHNPSGNGSMDQRPSEGGVTLESYAGYTKLPLEFLESLGLTETHYVGNKAVRIPYLDEDGASEALIRFRVSLSGNSKVRTRKNDKHQPYGLWKLEEARKAGHVFIVEGESDTQTLWYYCLPALGIPGANTWRPEWARYLDGVDRLYFVVEDEAGERCFEKLVATPEIRERLYRIDLDGAKDVSELHKTRPENFLTRLGAARTNARAWLDIAETEQQEKSREAWSICRGLAEEPDILEVFERDLVKSGVSGENRNGKLLYLALTSRLLDRIVSVAVKGPSSGGKSYIVGKVVGFFPASAVYKFSSFSARTLYYTEEPLSN